MLTRLQTLMTANFFALCLYLPAAIADNNPVMVNIKRLSLDTALKIAKTAIDSCRKAGFQVAVTVVDRGGNTQVVLQDTLAPNVTLRISYQKAYTAMSFNAATSTITGLFKKPFSVGKVQDVLLHPGGVPVTAGGSVLGGVGVSGAPDGHDDEKCAKAGVAAVSDDLEMSAM